MGLKKLPKNRVSVVRQLVNDWPCVRQVMGPLGKLPSTQKARVVLDHRFVQLLRFYRD